MPTVAERLLARLRAGGTDVSHNDSSDFYVINRWGDEEFEDPIRFYASGQALTDYLRQLADDAAILWPDMEKSEAALNLMLVHLEEAILTRRGATTVVLTSRGPWATNSPPE